VLLSLPLDEERSERERNRREDLTCVSTYDLSVTFPFLPNPLRVATRIATQAVSGVTQRHLPD
jgi:hypothetical protein